MTMHVAPFRLADMLSCGAMTTPCQSPTVTPFHMRKTSSLYSHNSSLAQSMGRSTIDEALQGIFNGALAAWHCLTPPGAMFGILILVIDHLSPSSGADGERQCSGMQANRTRFA